MQNGKKDGDSEVGDGKDSLTDGPIEKPIAYPCPACGLESNKDIPQARYSCASCGVRLVTNSPYLYGAWLLLFTGLNFWVYQYYPDFISSGGYLVVALAAAVVTLPFQTIKIDSDES